MQQLHVEVKLDLKQMPYLRKLAATECTVLSHICDLANEKRPQAGMELLVVQYW